MLKAVAELLVMAIFTIIKFALFIKIAIIGIAHSTADNESKKLTKKEIKDLSLLGLAGIATLIVYAAI